MYFARCGQSKLLLVTVFFGVACSDSVGPKLPAPSYDLVSYEGQTLPVVTRILIGSPAQPGGTGFQCNDRLLAMTLSFSRARSFTQTESRLLICDDGRPDAPSTIVTQGSYKLAGETLVLTEDLGGGAVLVGTARFTDADLTIYHREVSVPGFGESMTDSPLVFVVSG